jgi:hypothetical protein
MDRLVVPLSLVKLGLATSVIMPAVAVRRLFLPYFATLP